MIMLSLLIFSILQITLILFKKTKYFYIFSGVFLICFLATGSGLIPKLLLEPLQTQEKFDLSKLKKKNIFILLGSGVSIWPNRELKTTGVFGFSRLFETARIYHACRQKTGTEICHILATGGAAGDSPVPEAEVMARELMDVGVKKEDIILETKSLNTFQNAKFSWSLIKETSYDQTVIVSSGLHIPRCLDYFAHFGIKAEGAPSDRIDIRLSLLPRSLSFMVADLAIHEYLGIMRLRVYNFLGWN